MQSRTFFCKPNKSHIKIGSTSRDAMKSDVKKTALLGKKSN